MIDDEEFNILFKKVLIDMVGSTNPDISWAGEELTKRLEKEKENKL